MHVCVCQCVGVSVSACVWLCLAVSGCVSVLLSVLALVFEAGELAGGQSDGRGGGLPPFFDLSTNRLNFRKPVKQLQMNGIPVANSPDGKRPNQSAELKHARQVPCNTRG